jgi:hypothetical protein
MVFGADPRRIDLDQSPAGARGRGMLKSTACFLCSYATNDIGDFRVVGLDQLALTSQGVLDLTGEHGKLFARMLYHLARIAWQVSDVECLRSTDKE